MAECAGCKREKLVVNGCGIDEVSIGGKVYKRIPYGKEPYFELDGSQERCPDCGARIGFIHHAECSLECCPVCGEELMGCDCEDVHIMPMK